MKGCYQNYFEAEKEIIRNLVFAISCGEMKFTEEEIKQIPDTYLRCDFTKKKSKKL